MRYVRLRWGESPPPIISDFRALLNWSFRIANFGLLISGSPTCWHLEIVVKPRNTLFATESRSKGRRSRLPHASHPFSLASEAEAGVKDINVALQRFHFAMQIGSQVTGAVSHGHQLLVPILSRPTWLKH
jgi:hypothetical protein